MCIREMMYEDIDFALTLTSIEGWSDIRGDFEALVSYHPIALFVMESSKDLVGMVSAVSYGRFGFIGSLIVHPSYRGNGFGAKLLQHGINHLQKLGTSYIMLDAVPDAMSLYEKHGFHPVCKSYRFRGKISGGTGEKIREISEKDLSTVFDLDRLSFGADRSYFLQKKWTTEQDLCVCLERDDKIVSYAMGSHCDEYVRVAPWISTVHGDFNGDLLREISNRSGGREMALGILETSRESYDITMSAGLVLGEYSHSIRMVKGDIQPSFSSNQYAIGSPAKG